MKQAYVVGQMTVKNETKWAEYRGPAAYQALIPIRTEAADVVLTTYEV